MQEEAPSEQHESLPPPSQEVVQFLVARNRDLRQVDSEQSIRFTDSLFKALPDVVVTFVEDYANSPIPEDRRMAAQLTGSVLDVDWQYAIKLWRRFLRDESPLVRGEAHGSIDFAECFLGLAGSVASQLRHHRWTEATETSKDQ